jgi:hypothetical protein
MNRQGELLDPRPALVALRSGQGQHVGDAARQVDRGGGAHLGEALTRRGGLGMVSR